MDYSMIFDNGFAVCRFGYLSGSFIVKSPMGGIVKISKESFVGLDTMITRVASNIFLNWDGKNMKKFRQDYRKEIVMGVRPDEMKRYAEHGELIDLEELEKLKNNYKELRSIKDKSEKASWNPKGANTNINQGNLQYFLGSIGIRKRDKHELCIQYVNKHMEANIKKASWSDLAKMIGQRWQHFKRYAKSQKKG